MKYLPLLTYAWAIIIGGLIIFLPSGIHVCIACESSALTAAAVVSIVLGIAGLATQAQAR